jgi:flagellar motor switch protein FliG
MPKPLSTEATQEQREERVLTLLYLLGEDATEQVLGRLDPQLTSTLRNRLQNFADRLPPVRKQQQVLDEFDRFFHFASASRPSLRIHAGGGEEEEDDDAPSFIPTGDALADLEKMNIYQLGGALEQEQPRTVALLLKVVSPKRAAQLLNLLPEERRELVVREMSRDPRAPEIILRRIAATAVERAATLPAEPPKKEDPVQRMVAVLRATDKAKRRQMLKALEAQDAEQAAQINQSLYQFEDLGSMEDAQIQKILSRIDSASLSMALYGADEAILGKIMGNLSKRARASLQEELSFLKNVNGTQQRAARQLVVQAIMEVEQEAE